MNPQGFIKWRESQQGGSTEPGDEDEKVAKPILSQYHHQQRKPARVSK
jgi:hypothetical protein